MMVEFTFEAAAIGAIHSHPHVQASYIARCAFEVTIAGTMRRVTAGEAYSVPPETEHGVKALEPGLVIDSFAPRRDDV